MPFYNSIDSSKPEGRRTAEGLLRLKEALDKEVPHKSLDQTLLIASWNVREFGGDKYGGREHEPLFYIAEIMSRFDLIALQEARNNLAALEQLMNILGGWWKFLVSDVTQGQQGNSERLAFIYDTRKLAFGGLAGKLVPPMTKLRKLLMSKFAFARVPYLVGFRAGWFKFTICTSHLYYGKAIPDDKQRQKESEELVQLLINRMKQKDRWALNSILLGDFNVFSTKDETFKVLEKNKFQIPEGLRGRYTNAKLDKPFDQMAFLAPSIGHQVKVAKAGVFPFYNYVFRDQDRETYAKGKSETDYHNWRTYKMSDHLPIWVELGVDFGKGYLRRKMKPPHQQKRREE